MDPITCTDGSKQVRQGDFRIMFNRKGSVFRDRVTFRFQKSQVDEITLTGSADSIQVDMVRCIPVSEGLPSFHECCHELLLAITCCSQHINEVLYGNLGLYGRAVTITNEFGFKCLTCQSKDVHYCKFKPKQRIFVPLCCSNGKYHIGTKEEKCWLSADGLHVCDTLSFGTWLQFLVTFFSHRIATRLR